MAGPLHGYFHELSGKREPDDSGRFSVGPADADAHANVHANTDEHTHADADVHANTDVDQHTHADVDQHTYANRYACSGTGLHAGLLEDSH
jgi:hypothetical protein